METNLWKENEKDGPDTEYYEIKIKGNLDQYWSDWFASLTLAHLEGDMTILSSLLPDQVALRGGLERIRNLNLMLFSVTSNCPSNQYAQQE